MEVVLNERDYYVIKQSNGVIWNFTYEEDKGIIYRYLKEGKWCDNHVLTDKGNKNFSAALFPNDNICILYQDAKGHINLSNYDGNEWREQQILKNEKSEIFHICFKAVVFEKQIHVVYSILDKTTGITTLFHQTLDEKNNLSSPMKINIIKFHYQIPFNLYSIGNEELCIMYQNLTYNHQLGYKVFSKDTNNWSNFYLVDISEYPFKDYSILMLKGKIYTSYIKSEENINSLIHAYGNNSNLKYNKLCEGINIDSCSLSILFNQVWCFWIQDNRLYSSFSMDNGNNFVNPPHCKPLTSSSITKSIYRSNYDKDIKYLVANEVYVINENCLEYLIISKIYSNITGSENNNYGSSYIIYFIDKLCEKVSLYEIMLKQKEQFITQIKNMHGEQEIKSLSYERKLKEINELYAKFREGKEMLNKNIDFLQKSLIDREKKINDIENINIEKENEIYYLRNEIKSLKEQIEGLNLQLTLANSKMNKSLFRRIFSNK
ncbi:hypothetical protein [Clostridium sp. DJ247]|uniref:hypothetical protein n=1 Tax=Clostridium sp. DJ247 TaxID=2726188 RepID=UPI0016264061|nr:hypothetical protein [Clostridium sp. DJ247]MBC2580273.1 hypothetical protein [Clostridium sp. DJ247]